MSRSKLCPKDVQSLLMLLHWCSPSSQGQRRTFKDQARGWHWTTPLVTIRATESHVRASSCNRQKGPRVGTWSRTVREKNYSWGSQGHLFWSHPSQQLLALVNEELTNKIIDLSRGGKYQRDLLSLSLGGIYVGGTHVTA